MLSKVEILNMFDEDEFKKRLSRFLNEGYELKSSAVGFVNSESYSFCSYFQALLVKLENNYTTSPKYKIGTKVKIVEKDLLSRGDIGKIVGYQGPMFEHKKAEHTIGCMYVITYFDTECEMECTYAFEENQFIIIQEENK